ncbi:hypothetical protein D3C81_2307450 [compost metagenome]
MKLTQQMEEVPEEAGGADRPAVRVGNEVVHLLRVAAEPVKSRPDRREGAVICAKYNSVQQHAAVVVSLEP